MTPSGRFVLRIEPTLHASLKAAAERAGMSLNEFCVRKLTLPGDPPARPLLQAVERASAMFGEGLVGVVAYGSWARDELAAGSDVDLLVIVDPGVAITRGLYRGWDEDPIQWEGHSVEPHFVHLPTRDGSLTGTWAEVATEGIVLVERAFEVSRALAGVRRQIHERRYVRRSAQGHPYWVEAAR